ncbi:hypothetical protein N7448_010940 [Penicillium atrosanguineum]|nr:hypothetical protein N7448_010940 [Penicillium atrosanguineum]
MAREAQKAKQQHQNSEDHDVYPQTGSRLIGGPSGNNGDGGFVSPYYANVKTNTRVNEWNKDDHSIHLKHKDVHPRPPMGPVAFGSPVANGPHVLRMGPLEKPDAPGVTLIGGPSGNDGGEAYGNPTTVDVSTAVYEHNEDDPLTWSTRIAIPALPSLDFLALVVP